MDLNQYNNSDLAALLHNRNPEPLTRVLHRKPRPPHPDPIAEDEIQALEQWEARQVLRRLNPQGQERVLALLHQRH